MLYDFGFEIICDRERWEDFNLKLFESHIPKILTLNIVVACPTIIRKAPQSHERLTAGEILKRLKPDIDNDRHSLFRKYCYVFGSLNQEDLQKIPECQLQLFSWFKRQFGVLARPLERDELLCAEQNFLQSHEGLALFDSFRKQLKKAG